MNEARAKRILDELQKQGVSQMLLTDPKSIYYLTGVSMAPIERFYALLLRADGHHAYFLNHLFHVPQEVGVEKVWYSDTDPVAEIVAAHLDKNAVLGVDKDLKARFLLPLMEMNAAAGFVNASAAVDITRGVKDAEEQEKMRVASDINDQAMARFLGISEKEMRALRVEKQVLPSYKMVDTCAAEFAAETPYFYASYDEENEALEFLDHDDPNRKTVIVFGSGPIRIGQGIEFDYASVHCVWALKKAGYEVVIVNNNPETVSTDFDTSDRLYFEPLTPEDVMGVIHTRGCGLRRTDRHQAGQVPGRPGDQRAGHLF